MFMNNEMHGKCIDFFLINNSMFQSLEEIPMMAAQKFVSSEKDRCTESALITTNKGKETDHFNVTTYLQVNLEPSLL